MKKISIALLSSAMFFTSCDVSSFFRGYDLVDATKAVVWNYSESDKIFEVDPTTLSVQINNIPSDKTLYLVKRNIGDANISFEDTRTIQGHSDVNRSVISENDFVPELSEIDAKSLGFRKHFVPQELPSLKSSNARVVAGATLKTTSAVQNFKIGKKKSIYIDVDKDMKTYTQKSATLRAIGEKCYVWIVDDYYGNNTGNKVNETVAQKYAAAFDAMYPVITNVFGTESEKIYDYDVGDYGDIKNYSDTGDKINIVIYDIATDYKNAETVSTGGVVGYFYSKDYYYTNVLQSQAILNKSNVGKYFYIDSGFANSNFNDTISTLAHEFQHMLNFNQKNIIRNIIPSTSYNETLSMLCEDMMQEYLGLEDYASPKNRMQSFNAYYWMSGITEYRNDNLAALSYSTSYAFGSWLVRQYVGAELVKIMMKNAFVDNNSMVAAVNAYNLVHGNASKFTYEDLFKQFLLALTKDTTYTHNQNASQTVTYTGGSETYNYPMKAFDIFSDKKTPYKHNGEDAIYTFSLKNWVLDKEKGTTFESQINNANYQNYDWNGPLIFAADRGPSELRAENGITIHGIVQTSECGNNEIFKFTPKGAETLKMYLIIQ